MKKQLTIQAEDDSETILLDDPKSHNSAKIFSELMGEEEKEDDAEKALSKKKLRYQIQIYAMTYFSTMILQFQREFWSMSKDLIVEDPRYDGYITERDLSNFDTCQFFIYGIAAFFGGVIADMYDYKKLLSLSYLGLGLCCLF